MARASHKSFRERFLRGQGGNFVVYLAGLMILWFVFFTVKDWIKDTKEARLEESRKKHQQEVHYMPGDIYHNPYQ